ncbi:MAG: caspase family protein [bacterium]
METQHKIVSWFVVRFVVMSVNVFAQQPELVVQTGHAEDVSTVAFSLDGKLLASGGRDKAVILWDVKTGKQMRTLTGHSDKIKTVAFLPGGKYFISSSIGETKLWNMETWNELRRFSSGGTVAVSTDGKTIATGGGDGVQLFDVKAGRAVQTFKGSASALKFSPDGTMLASATSNGKSVQLWDLNSGKSLRVMGGHKGTVISIAFSPDSKLLASGDELGDGTIELFDVATGKELKTFSMGTPWANGSLEFSRDGKVLISAIRDALDPVIRFWDIEKGVVIKTLKGHASSVYSISLSPDGMMLASGSADKSIRLWEIDAIMPSSILAGYSSPVQQVALSPDGKLLATAHGEGGILGSKNESVRLWDLATGQGVKTLSGHLRTVTCVAFNPNGKLLASGSKDYLVKIWDISTGKEIRSFNAHNKNEICAVAFSPDGKTLATGGSDKYLRLWDTESWQEIKSAQHEDGVVGIAYSSDGKIVATCIGSAFGIGRLSKKNDIQLWNAKTGENIRSLSEPGRGEKPLDFVPDVKSVAFSPNGKILAAGCSDKTIKMWEVASGRFIGSGEAHTDDVRSIAYSPDGGLLASSSASLYGAGDDFDIKLWDTKAGRQLNTLSGHSNGVVSVAFSRDGKFLFSGSSDARTKIWDVATGKELATLIGLGEKDWVVVTPDGRFDGPTEGMKLIHYVQEDQVIPLDALFEQFYTPKLLAQVMSGQLATLKPPAVDLSKGMKLPPLVRIVSPKEGESFSKESITVSVEATDQGGGIDEIRLYQNGKLVSEDQRGMKVVSTVGSKRTKEFKVTLLPGMNEFSATAFNTDRTESTPASLKIELRAVSSGANLYVLAIGINEYTNSKYTLNYGRPDAQAFLESVVQRAVGIFKEVKQEKVYDREAVRSTIEGAFKKVMSEARPQDVFVFFYAGHGVMSEGDAASPAEFYLIPSDITQLYGRDEMLKAKGISAKMLREYCSGIKAQKQLVVIDACQSGGAVETFAMRGASEEKAILQLARSAGVVVLASTGSEQFASEFKQLGHGVFTYALLEGIAGEADGSPKDGKITVKELEAYLNEKVPELTTRYRGAAQYPNSYSKGQDFPLVVK